MKTQKLPAIFFGHGNPMNAIRENIYSKTWEKLAKSLPKPKSILVISAHWEIDGTKITDNENPKTIHDFYGFPQELFDVQYRAKGDKNLVKRIQELVAEATPDSSWGIDHGAWSVLKHLYPKADIPVVQLSIDAKKTPNQHYEIAKKLKALREEGVLIIGSGNIVHNLRMMKWHGSGEPYSWALEFNEAIKNAILKNEYEKILDYKTLPGAQYSVPTTEHFVPLIYVVALQEKNERAEIFLEKIDLASVSMMCVVVK